MLSPQLASLELTAIPTPIRQIRVCFYPISYCCSRHSDHSIRSSSPFWRTSSSNSKRDASLAGERKVFGASYSHADILNFDNLYAFLDAYPRRPALTTFIGTYLTAAHHVPTPHPRATTDRPSKPRPVSLLQPHAARTPISSAKTQKLMIYHKTKKPWTLTKMKTSLAYRA